MPPQSKKDSIGITLLSEALLKLTRSKAIQWEYEVVGGPEVTLKCVVDGDKLTVTQLTTEVKETELGKFTVDDALSEAVNAQ